MRLSGTKATDERKLHNLRSSLFKRITDSRAANNTLFDLVKQKALSNDDYEYCACVCTFLFGMYLYVVMIMLDPLDVPFI